MEQRVLLVGPGAISRKYLEVMARVDGMSCVGVVGRDPGKTLSFAAEHGIQYHGVSIAEVARASGATMALVCTPNAAHYEAVITAARLGLHVLCEKPLEITPERQHEMIRVCRENQVRLGVGFSNRFLGHLRYLKDLLDSGALGRVLVMDVRMRNWRDSSYYTQSSWHGTADVDGGGPFIQQGSHLIDLALWLGQGFATILAARRFTVLHPIEVEDHGYAVVKYGNGAVGVIEASTVCRGQQANEIEVYGEKGSLAVSFAGITDWNVEGVERPAFPGEGRENKSMLFAELLADFKEAVETGREPFISGESGKLAVELIQAIYAKSGEPMRLGGQPGEWGREEWRRTPARS